jgi:hypothetical protein
MKVRVKITGIKNCNELPNYWTKQDYYNLLEKFGFAEANKVPENEILDMLRMAVTDFDPNEAAQILLEYKLGDKLNEGQIASISNEMTNDRVAEEYPDPTLHYDLFNINQFLYKAYNGTFPNTEATVLNFDLQLLNDTQTEITNEIIAKALGESLSERSIIKRLYTEQLEGNKPFEDLGNFIWTLNKTGNNSYELTTSKYWIDKEDIEKDEYETEIKQYEE